MNTAQSIIKILLLITVSGEGAVSQSVRQLILIIDLQISRIRTTSTRLDLKFILVFSKTRHLGKLHCAFLAVSNVKLSADRKMKKLQTFHKLFPPLRHSRYKTRGRRTKAITFSRQNDADSCASTAQLYSIKKIPYPQSSSSWNVKVSITAESRKLYHWAISNDTILSWFQDC